MLPQQLGAMQSNRMVEYQRSEDVRTRLFPTSTPEDGGQHEAWRKPHAMDADTGHGTLLMPASLGRTRHHHIMVETWVGAHKPRPSRANWPRQSRGTVPANLAAAGIRPEQIDDVCCTHRHVDHGGGNTRWHDGRWVPMFPNATSIFSKKAFPFWEALPRDEKTAHFVDSVLPIVEAGQAVLVENTDALNDAVWRAPPPGHTPAHVRGRLSSNGAPAVMTGEMIHSPGQCLGPEWGMRADTAPVQACQTRRAFLERYGATDVLVCGAHFPAPSMGHIVARDQAFWFQCVPTVG